MRSRTVREGSVGLLILLGLGLFVGIILWIRGFTLGNRSYKIIFDFANINGMQVGSQVRYRGVTVGKITKITPGVNIVEVEVEVSPADTVIPRNVVAQANPVGFLGDTSIDITPTKPSLSVGDTKPLDRNCDNALIVCSNTHVPGQVGVSVDDVLKAALKFSDLYSDPKLVGNANAVLKNAADAAAEVAALSREFRVVARSVQGELANFSTTSRSIGLAANQVGSTVENLNSFLTTNRSTTVNTLENINAISVQLRTALNRLDPTLNQLERSRLIQNLDTLSANAAEAAANFRDVSKSLNNPANLLVIQQTLDSARATFQNAQKITADLDELTGDPVFRANLKNLVNSLNGLVSSTQQLQQQAQLNQALTAIAATPTPPPLAQAPESIAPQPKKSPTPTPTSLPTPPASPPPEPQ
jgi:phospholipid/cholesterol/gamma-HCH transport system substrate-binding protein